MRKKIKSVRVLTMDGNECSHTGFYYDYFKNHTFKRCGYCREPLDKEFVKFGNGPYSKSEKCDEFCDLVKKLVEIRQITNGGKDA